MKLNTRLLLAVAVSALTVPAIAFAAKADRKNKDQAADKSDKAAGAFAKADKDSDGFVTESEFVASRGKKADQGKTKTQFGKMDKNSDGKLSKEEFEAAASRGKKK
jgi:Ca2+-binding EF-hand superfamily protein